MSNIQTYQEQQLAQKNNNPDLASLTEITSNSKVSIWRLWLYICAFIANDLRQLYGVHKQEVADLINAQKITNEEYYRTVALAFRDGHTFDSEKLEYYGNYTDAQIADAQKIKRCAVQVVTAQGRQKLFVKVATEDANGKLVKLPADVFARFQTYMNLNKPAGVNIVYQSIDADKIRITADVYVDTSILLLNGDRIDGQFNAPVEQAVYDFFTDKNFKFDGEIVLSLLANKMQIVEGVLDEAVRFENVESSYTTPDAWNLILERYTANSGYFEVVELNINYLTK